MRNKLRLILSLKPCIRLNLIVNEVLDLSWACNLCPTQYEQLLAKMSEILAANTMRAVSVSPGGCMLESLSQWTPMQNSIPYMNSVC